jgi:hypothetical protein
MGGVYLRYGETFVAMYERPYEAEELLQVLIAEHPEVLAAGCVRTGVFARRGAGVSARRLVKKHQ